jgi:HEAT repeat protein
MALFGGGRGKEVEILLKRIEGKGYRGPGEKRALIQELGQHELRADLLMRLLTGGDADLARFAVEKLGTSRDPGSLDMLLGALQRVPRGRWRPIVAAIHRMNSPALDDKLGLMMRSKRVEAREAALEVIAQDTAWTRHLSSLKAALRDESNPVRARAVQVLGTGIEDHSVRRVLQELLYNPDDTVRHAAIEALSLRPHLDVIEDFFDLLPNEKPKQQDLIVRGIKKLLAAEGRVSEKVQDRILPLLAAEDERIRRAAAQLLGSIPDKLYVLRRFFVYAKGIAFWLRDRAFTAVSAVADDVTEAVLVLLEDRDLDIVVGATTMAGNSQDPRVVEGLWGVLEREDLDWWVKVPALENLAVIAHPSVEQMLIAKLDDPELRTAALASLGKRVQPSSLPHIQRYLTHERRSVRHAAIGALREYREAKVVRVLEEVARTDRDEECRMLALELLDENGAEGAVAAKSVRDDAKRPAPSAGEGLTLTMLDTDPEVD